MGGWTTTGAGAQFVDWLAEPADQYRLLAVVLWELALVVYVLGDTGLTTVVLSLGGFEASPVARAFLSTLGYAGLVVQKELALGLVAVVWTYYPTIGDISPDPWRLVVPAILVARGAQLVAIHLSNVAVLL
jgi:hypothetical protein